MNGYVLYNTLNNFLFFFVLYRNCTVRSIHSVGRSEPHRPDLYCRPLENLDIYLGELSQKRVCPCPSEDRDGHAPL